MPLSPDPAAALERVRALVRALPETSERLSHAQPTFFVAGKMFAQFRHAHHGIDTTIVAIRAGDEEEAAMLIEMNPDLYGRVAYFRRDWVGLAIGLDDTDWEHVADRLARSWALAAPAKLLAAR